MELGLEKHDWIPLLALVQKLRIESEGQVGAKLEVLVTQLRLEEVTLREAEGGGAESHDVGAAGGGAEPDLGC